MNAYKIAVIAYLILGALATVGQVGKPRDPISPSLAVSVLLATVVLSVLVTRA